MKVDGVVYQATYRVQNNVPVVHLFGRTADGRSFLARDNRERPHFYIREADAAKAPDVQTRPVEHRSMQGEALRRVDVQIPQDAPPLRDRLHARGVATFEADVRFAMRYLIDRKIRAGVAIEGEPTSAPQSRCDLVFDNAEVTAADVRVEPNVLSFDIETNPHTDRLLAISVYGLGLDEVAIVDGSGRDMPAHAMAMADEYALLSYFCDVLQRSDVDVLTGWNVVDFDLAQLAKAAERLKHPFQLGRLTGKLRLRAAEGYFGSGQASIPGRLVLDGIDLLRGAFVRMDDYTLDGVSREVLGEGKAVEGDVHDRVGEILHNYRHNLPAFAEYARTDARLAYDIVGKLDLVRLSFARSRYTGMTPDRVSASIASFDTLYLSQMFARGIAAPTVRNDDSRVYAAQAGGQVFEPVTGVHELVWVFDFKSLYPSIIRTYGIDPLYYVGADETAEGTVVTSDGTRFRRGSADAPAILPSMLDRLFPEREKAKREGDEVASQAIKILMNSFYGVLGTPACRFHNPAIANAITAQGRHLLEWLKRWFEAAGFVVLYGDTDSVFVSSGVADGDEADALARELLDRVNAELAEYVQTTSGVTSRLELEYEKLYAKLFLASVRHGSGGARKRYAGIRVGAAEPEFVGMEVVRRDWTDLAKVVQRGLYQRLFAGDPVNEYLHDVVADLRSGRNDDQLVYRKGLRKAVEEYTANTPPHVAAARKSNAPVGRIVEYVMTLAGPEPLDAISAPYDVEHYVNKQIKPVAEPVLSVLGLDFAQVIGDDRQLGLF